MFKSQLKFTNGKIYKRTVRMNLILCNIYPRECVGNGVCFGDFMVLDLWLTCSQQMYGMEITVCDIKTVECPSDIDFIPMQMA